jgi:hypothetical protein
MSTGGSVDGGPGGEDPPSGGKVPVEDNEVPSMVCATDDEIESVSRGESVRCSHLSNRYKK